MMKRICNNKILKILKIIKTSRLEIAFFSAPFPPSLELFTHRTETFNNVIYYLLLRNYFRF
jgi:hypothetical protein